MIVGWIERVVSTYQFAGHERVIFLCIGVCISDAGAEFCTTLKERVQSELLLKSLVLLFEVPVLAAEVLILLCVEGWV